MKYEKLNIEIISEHYFDNIIQYDDYIGLYSKGVLKFKVYCNSTVNAFDSSTVYIYENSAVAAYENSTVFAYNSSTVYALDNSTVYAYDISEVYMYDSSEIYAFDNSEVIAYDNSKVNANDISKVIAYNNSIVYAYDNSEVYAYGNCKIERRNKMKINEKELDRYCDSIKVNTSSYKLADPQFSLCEGCPFDHPDDCLKETVADFEDLEKLYFKAKKALELYQQQKAEKQKFVGVKFQKDEVVYVFKNDLGELEDDEEVVVKTKYGYAIGRVTPVPATFDLTLAKDISKKILYKLDTLLEKEK